uniref:Uncharacterized protein MANES_S060000 n=1 Tax=Rhizophora mucronata TaxID=61149 RepID=A0A2P2QYK8_RHIMU
MRLNCWTSKLSLSRSCFSMQKIG